MTTTAAASSSSPPTASLIEHNSPPTPQPPTPPPPQPPSSNHKAQLESPPQTSEQQEHTQNSPAGSCDSAHTSLQDHSLALQQQQSPSSSSSSSSPKPSQEHTSQLEPPQQQKQAPDQQIQLGAHPNPQQDEARQQQTPPIQISKPSSSTSSSQSPKNQVSQPTQLQHQTQLRPSLIEEPQLELQKLHQQTTDAPVTAIAATHSNSSSNNNIEQKRPMNAFLLFCKRQRSLVKEKYPNLENRSITKILGDWWSKLEKEQKDKYTELARQHKEAFMKANPDFKWCKTPISNNTNNSESGSNSSNNNITNSNPNRNDNCYIAAQPRQITRDSMSTNDHMHQNHNHLHNPFTNLNHLSQQQQPIAPPHPNPSQLEAPKPPKKRFLERNDSIYSSNHDSNFRVKDAIVPYISPFDQDTLDRVIDEAFSENSNNSPSSSGGGGTVLNMCKYSNNNNNNTPTSTAIVAPLNPPVTSSYSTSSCIDEPVDFSMNRTISRTSQQIINSLVEKMLSGPDNVSG